MSKDNLSVKGRGFIINLILQGGGIKNFIFLVAVIGVICFFFSWITGSILPFVLFAIVAVAVVALFIYLALRPEGRIFFLESSYFYRVIAAQMGLLGDKGEERIQLKDAEIVQPILQPPNKEDKEKVLEG